MANQNSKSPRFWTPKLIIGARHASCCIWYGGQVMKAQMKKPRGSSHPRLIMPPNLFKTFTSPTHPNLDPYPFLKVLCSLLSPTFFNPLNSRSYYNQLSILLFKSEPFLVTLFLLSSNQFLDLLPHLLQLLFNALNLAPKFLHNLGELSYRVS